MSAPAKPLSVKVFIDLDEVLADWLTPALNVMNHNPAKVFAAWDKLDPRPWDVFDVIETSKSRGWQALELAGASFWAHLPLLPHAKHLFKMCEAIGETTVLTSPSLHPSSYSGKVHWLNYHFGKGFAHKRALLGASKHVVARPGAVLIDDSPTHCEAWRAEGGHAILFPGHGNDLHAHRDRAFAYILPELMRLRAESEAR